MRAAAVLLLCLAAAAFTGCRSSAPLAPKSQVQNALSSMGIYCGQATQLEAFPGHTAGVKQLDLRATRTAHELIRIMRADPEATYLGQNMRRIVGTVAKEMDSCYLPKASSLLWRSLG